MEKIKHTAMRPERYKFISETKHLWLLLLCSAAFFGLLKPGIFFSRITMNSMAFQMPELGMFVLAMLFPIVSGGLNLSIIATGNICALIIAGILNGVSANGLGLFAGLILGMASAAVIGILNGGIAAYTGAHPILVSLGSMTMINGIGIYFTRGTVISGFASPVLTWIGNGTVLGIPAPFVLFIFFACITGFILSHTPFGLYVRMIGSNPEATRYSGINISFVYIKIYIYSSFMAFIAGIIMMSRFNSARIGYGDGYLLVSILVLILGGVDPLGGFGKVFKIVFALFVLQTVASGLNLLRADQHLIMVIWGLILLCAMVLGYVQKVLQDKKNSMKHRHEF